MEMCDDQVDMTADEEEAVEHMGPLLMHDVDQNDDEDGHSLSSHDPDTILTDVHLPSDNLIPSHDVSKDEAFGNLDTPIADEGSSSLKSAEPDTDQDHESADTSASCSDDPPPIKFCDGQPVQLEDGSTAYILTSHKEGTQPIILEDGRTAYISHQPPSSLFESGLTGLESISAINDSEVKQIAQSSLAQDDQKIFKCTVDGCQKVYSTYHHLQYHRRSHLEKKPFVCGYSGCEKTFATSYGLKSHIRVHTGEKPYKCPEHNCPKAFKTSGDLQKHIRTHTGEKPFRCPFEGCNRSFTTSNIRKVHIRTHTGERPYSCTQCGRTFASATNHKNHMRIHSGEKPYACNFDGCTKRFTEYSSLYKHHIVHTQSKPYVCSVCGKHYRQTSTLATHKRTAHGESEFSLSVAIPGGSRTVEGDMLAVEQNKELMGINLEHGKQLASTSLVGSNVISADKIAVVTANSTPAASLSLSELDAQNVVIVTSTNGYRVVQPQSNVTAVNPTNHDIQLPQSEASSGTAPELASSTTQATTSGMFNVVSTQPSQPVLIHGGARYNSNVLPH